MDKSTKKILSPQGVSKTASQMHVAPQIADNMPQMLSQNAPDADIKDCLQMALSLVLLITAPYILIEPHLWFEAILW